jgi:multiple sugar transport system ATP-binding protein
MTDIVVKELTKRYPNGFEAVKQLSLEIGEAELLVLVGPSGCGKTTALRMIAGLEDITSGDLYIGGRRMNNVPEKDRDIAMVFQNYALYPHMTVAQNIGFSLKLTRTPKSEIRERVRETARLLAIEQLLDRRPKQLSGGQRQRVAMGRAVIRQPQVFLMDEPLSNLDAQLRVHMRGEIEGLQKRLGVTTVYVTHDQVEAMTMGDRVAVLRRGLLQQFDAPQLLYEKPANLFVASFIGSPAMNILEGTLEPDGDGLAVQIGATTFALPAEVLNARPALRDNFRKPIAVGIRPEALDEPGRRNGEADGRLRGRVTAIEALGPEQLAYVDIDAQPVLVEDVLEGLVDMEAAEDIAAIKSDADGAARANVVARLEASTTVRPDDTLELSVDLRRLHFFDLDSGEAIA